MMKKILVPIDGSEPSVKALDSAVDLADKYSAEILILSVVPHITVPAISLPPATVHGEPVPPSTTLGPYLMELKNGYKDALSNALQWVKKNRPGVKASTKLMDGRPSDIIIQTAKDEACDIIVIGSRGLGRMKGLLLGSVSRRVVDDAPCPVLVVK